MDIGTTISAVRREYKEYLESKNPEWAESTVKTHVSDAFYIWNNVIVVSFWKLLENEESMRVAEIAIHEYLRDELLAENAEQRAKSYFKDLCMLKSFLDEKYGGVRARVGDEFDCEERIYLYSKAVYEGEISAEHAAKTMAKEIPCFNETSHKMTISTFNYMMKGEIYKRRCNIETTVYFAKRIAEDYGPEYMRNALIATQENIKYFYECSGGKSNGMRRSCRKLAAEYGIDVDFSERIFGEILPAIGPVDEMLIENAGNRYWIYSPYDMWDKLQRQSIITIGRDYLGDPSLYASREEMQHAMQDCGTEKYTTTYKNASLELWQFVYDMNPGDIVFAKKGQGSIIGKGIVTSEFIYDETKPADFKYYREIKWTHSGEWLHPGNAVKKTLTDITGDPEYVKKLNALFENEENAGEEEVPELRFAPYTADDFLKDVFMSEERYNTLKKLLLTKKNIILQGAPGVGKTYIARRLAYSIMGEQDKNRVKMVQFHQSYSYEDFIMGFRPTQTGFELKTGAFYDFCKQAAEDERPYFFIIDEINRGNLSKIFGELFMLIENDKRGVGLQLLYSDEQFSIPGNVHIIGMMNTADRSLAMLDYALRRRFAFFDIVPAFDSSGFRAYRKEIGNQKFDNLIAAVQQLNEAIAADESLGEGFCVGHSYFYTKAAVSDEWLKSVVEFELIPLIKEYWFDDSSKVRAWTGTLREVIK